MKHSQVRTTKEMPLNRFYLKLFIAILAVTCFLPTDTSGELKSTREARHILMPYLGYQSFNNEAVEFSMRAIYRINLAVLGMDTTITVDSDASEERSVEAPMFGFMYSFRPNHMLNLDIVAAMVMDGKSYSYKAEIPDFGSTRVYDLSLNRGDTYFGCVDAGYNLPIPVRWFTVAIRGGGGYAWREVVVRNDYEPSESDDQEFVGASITVAQKNADRMYIARGGIDLTLWKKNQMVITGSLFFAQYIPTDSEIDPFGGIGWRMSFFPVWVGR